MKKITIINTGGTFNKIYNPIKGTLDIPKNHNSLDEILKINHNLDIEILDIISKDSLEFTSKDRELLLSTILKNKNRDIIVIHGTDTMSLSAKFIASNIEDKRVVFTGTMIPMSIDKVEATFNLSLALGFLNASNKDGIYIAMHGAVVLHEKIEKNVEIGKFLLKK